MSLVGLRKRCIKLLFLLQLNSPSFSGRCHSLIDWCMHFSLNEFLFIGSFISNPAIGFHPFFSDRNYFSGGFVLWFDPSFYFGVPLLPPPQIYTRRNTLLMAASLWALCFMIDFPNLVGLGEHIFDVKKRGCSFDRMHYYGYTLYFIGMGVATPMSIVVFCYINIFLFVRAHNIKVNY